MEKRGELDGKKGGNWMKNKEKGKIEERKGKKKKNINIQTDFKMYIDGSE